MRRVRLSLIGALIGFQPAAMGETLDWVALPGGCFEMGARDTYPEEAPAHRACVAPFAISRTEVTVGQFRAFVEATGYRTRAETGFDRTPAAHESEALTPGGAVFAPPQNRQARDLNWWRWQAGAQWRYPNGPDQGAAQDTFPVTQITLADAQAYADWVGARLPSEAEWEYAARGGRDGGLMAWDETERIALHARANTWQGVFPIVNTSDDGYPGTAPVASYPANGFGLYDMIGNVWEWTATPYAPSHAQADRDLAGANGLDFSQPGTPVGTIKGGSYLCAVSYCFRFRPAARQAQDLSYGTSHIGFRVARDATPDETD